jgi:polyisoprenoid-binding protein YceI
MVVVAGRHRLGPDRGRLLLRTFRDGLAAQAGHDLTIEATRWSGELVVNDDLSPASLEVRADLGALVVRDGTGGVKPLTDRDRREIAVTARKVLGADQHPEAVFVADSFRPAADDGEIGGTLTLRGQARPLRLQVKQTGADRYHAETQVIQSDYGIKPYTAFLGALRVRDAIDVAVEVDLSDPAAGPGTGHD